MKALILYTTLPDKKTAEKMARLLVDRKLAACVSIQENLLSYYYWKGKLQKARECLLLVKAKPGNYARLERLIKKYHPCELPEIIAVPIVKGLNSYLKWVNKS